MQQADYNPYGISYAHVPTSRSTTDFQDKTYIENYSSTPTRQNKTKKPSSHPLSLIFILLWTVLIIVVIALLERSVAVAPTIVKLPWQYSNDGLPSILLTIFAQGHVAVTAMHLSRLAVSALQFPRSAPRTWLEMFWLVDKKWAGPVGIFMAAGSMLKSPMWISPTLVLFSATILSALATPLVLNRTYPTHPIDVPVNRSFIPNTLSASRLAQIDAYAQSAVGAGSWATNLTVLELFNATSFTPAANRSRIANASDFFFAGDVQNMDTSLPGVRIQGGCFALQDQPGLTQDGFTQLCYEQLPVISDRATSVLFPAALNVSVSYCTTAQFEKVASPSNTSALVWFQNSNLNGVVKGDPVRGVVRCDTNFTTGTAFLSGRNLTFDHFVEDDDMYTPTGGGEPLIDPLYAALYYLAGLEHGTDSQEAQLFGMLGYTLLANDELGQVFVSPSPDGFADAMWRGATHMTMALAVLSRSSETMYAGTAYVPVTARTRSAPFFAAALALLGVWLLAMVGLTAAVWRPTVYGDSLDSYCAARLAVDRPDLVNGGRFGGISDNKKLVERFDPVVEEL